VTGVRRPALLIAAACGFAGWLWTGVADWAAGATLTFPALAVLAAAAFRRSKRRRARPPVRHGDRSAVSASGPGGRPLV